ATTATATGTATEVGSAELAADLGGDPAAVGTAGHPSVGRPHDRAHVLHAGGPGPGDHVGDDRGEVGVLELRRQVAGQHLALGLLALRLFRAAGRAERLGGLPALLRLPAHDGLDLVV